MKKQKSITTSEVKKPQNVLILTSSGGGGLIQAANAKKQEILQKNSHTKIFQRNILKEWVWKPVGPWAVRYWDRSQKEGNVKALENFLGLQLFAEIYFAPKIFFKMLAILFRKNIDKVIDTQPLATPILLKAIRIFNFFKKKKVFLEKVLVDLPTKGATHFFSPIRWMSTKDKKYFRLITIKPLLDEKESEAIFWQKNCRLPMKNIHYEFFCTRRAFKKYKKQKNHQVDISVDIDFGEPHINTYMIDTCKKGVIQSQVFEKKFTCKIQENDWVFTILLGSQPAFEATIHYIQSVMDSVSKTKSKRHFHVFVFCGKCEKNCPSLLQTVHRLVMTTVDFPSNLSIVPMSFQKEHVIAPLFFRSNMTLTRSGGQTMMELMEVSKADFRIHSEAKGKKPTHQQLLKGIPGWESGNASYLEKKYGAKIVTPQTFSETLVFHFLN